MQGHSGLETVGKSRLTGKPMMVFYAPIFRDQKITGQFLGLYFAEAAGVFLCTQDGRVIANSDSSSYNGDLLDNLTKSDVINAKAKEEARAIFANGNGATLVCSEDRKTDNLCIMPLPEYNYVLVQTFPENITQAMVNNANKSGVLLEICLLVLFVLYVIFLVIRAGRRRKNLESENKMFGDVLRGINILFASRYLVVDLENDSYSYIAGVEPLNNSIPMEGIYNKFIKFHTADIIDDEEKKAFAEFAQIDTIKETLAEKDFAVHECHVSRQGKEEWEHLLLACLERREGIPIRVLYTRQNITELKQKELLEQREWAILHRKDKQYRIAIMSSSFSTFEMANEDVIADPLKLNQIFINLMGNAVKYTLPAEQ